MIAIADYGVGNIFSLYSSFKCIGAEVVLTKNPEDLKTADKIILPGVGAFEDAAKKLRATGLDRVVIEQANAGKPLLGICLGMQVLFSKGYEGTETDGLGLLNGKVERIKTDLKLPQIGWNSLKILNPSPLTKGLSGGEYVYFVHSFYVPVCEWTIAQSDYINPFSAAIQRDNFYATQFHPEKSGSVGQRIIQNFLDL